MTTTSTSLTPTLEEAFAVGKLEGHKECMAELQEMIKEGATLDTLKIYLKAKSNVINLQTVNNPFKQKDS